MVVTRTNIDHLNLKNEVGLFYRQRIRESIIFILLVTTDRFFKRAPLIMRGFSFFVAYCRKKVRKSGRKDLHIDETPFFGLADKVSYDFYHTEKTRYHGIQNSKDIWLQDRYFNINEEDPFYFNSAFWRGCVRIKKK
ncbi:MAG: hypothetical protein ACNA7Y_03135 [Gammaproteobacteria bacterium]